MFSAFNRAIPQLSIFHNVSSPPSNAALRLLQAALSSPYPPSKPNAPPLKFNLDIVENVPPNPDQLRTIISYLPSDASRVEAPSPVSLLSAHPTVHTRPTSPEGVARLAAQNLNAIKWPIVVDWDHGKAAVGDVEGVKGILEELRKRRDGEIKPDEDKPSGWFS
ncbi:hypothetical protein POSPLADRAFT_1175056 [Postia placenta MAD-698-R-SB12]|uniref:Thioredoxin-like fold domain-containing protein n=1 Tax=Postia placenta MAD-698-R-SB12 TaxID=670580 RepID=A0A1X6MJV8_9APHY|nr:hypothetical protein POSPLADRAFT_1175056 [Postia placenta MAD-698-R-SB12]OSX56664.1 hypothetical protein POSPLADRAFT_1175056 [Postia placenta MAD-698-R-SB12]